MDRLFKPWSLVGASINESELSDSISNNLHHFMVAHSQSKNNASLKNTCTLANFNSESVIDNRIQSAGCFYCFCPSFQRSS